MLLSVPLEPPSKEILHISAHYLVILVKYKYYRKRGSVSYIVREVHSVRERERERDTEREKERERERRK